MKPTRNEMEYAVEPFRSQLPFDHTAGVGVQLVSRAEVLVDNIELNYWMKKKEKEQLRL